MKEVKCILLFFVFVTTLGFSQETTELSWWNPVHSPFHVVEGQGWTQPNIKNYNRLPDTAEGKVRKPVWNLSKQSAGLSIRFITNSQNIVVRYKVRGGKAFNHMPATGVSGVDLYTKTNDGEWLWNRGQYTFGDTITYNYTNLKLKKASHHNKGQEYVLYLPLYNEVDWLEIGTETNAVFNALPKRREKPIVVYGTSIAQGACASRPGMAWTSILGRNIDRPIINLGFSGNGRLEDEVLDYIETIDAKLYILDCLPNLSPTKERTLDFVFQRIVASVKRLKSKHPSTPILLVAHSGYSDGNTNKERYEIYSELNKALQIAYEQLVSEGVKDIYVLTKEELGLGIDSYVDGTHPSDLGMLHYAKAYEARIRDIIKEPVGNTVTTIPVTQNRDADVYNWNMRHQNILETNKIKPPKVCFIGNSIVHQWGGVPNMAVVNGADSWERYFEELGVRNVGYGWDRVENVLWRVYHDELDGFEAEQILLKIGTNNLHLNTNEEIIEGLRFLVLAIKERQPKAKIAVLGILPRRDQEARIKTLNLNIEKITKTLQVNYLSVGNALLNAKGLINESLFRDGLHPNAKGYNTIAPFIESYLLNK
ncbi:SGNH/GDSL hydrolase family protein [Snuella sedimenti]|uniref:SGNH/GDSL hydrolase family protein n=1 Tax=Snuella sedimenti TaxID=2798802 RepID=A0A8J7J5A9_9FLAO|nr:SGNH/GDSL hydrolase family protein [Snuella sedimenti]MBJ6368963.1 SGNH/GDSL hydrolase family protein [Snuella sedimenti]